MRVLVLGDVRTKPVLLDTDKPAGLIIYDNQGEAVTIYKFVENGFVRYTKGEDPNFNEIRTSLGL